MNIYLDCEFDGHTGPLMSMAMVAEDGREFYEVLNHDPVDSWVKLNVSTHLNKPAISDRQFRDKFIEFLLQFDKPNICVDWYVDLHYFFRWFGGKTYPDSFAYACTTEIQLIDQLQSALPHNALEDARALCRQWPNKVKTPFYEYMNSVVSAIRVANNHSAIGILEGVVLRSVIKAVGDDELDKVFEYVVNTWEKD